MPIEQNALYKYHPHWILYLQVYLTGIILIVVGVAYRPLWPVAILGVLIFILGEVTRKAVTYYILDSGVARGYHFLSTSRKFAEYGSIQNVEVHQSFFENILGIGSVKFDTSGSNLIEVNFHGVIKPYEIEKIVRDKMVLK